MNARTAPEALSVDELGDRICELSAHIAAATYRLLVMIAPTVPRNRATTGSTRSSRWRRASSPDRRQSSTGDRYLVMVHVDARRAPSHPRSGERFA